MAQPAIIQDNISVAGSTIVENLIAQNPALERYIKCPFPARGTLVAAVSAADLRLELSYAGKVVVEESDLRVLAAGNLLIPDDVINDSFYVPEGAMFTIRANNRTAGAKSATYRLILTPLAESGEVVELPPDKVVTLRGGTSIAAGNAGTQLLDGMKFEFPPVDSEVSFFLSASAAGLIAQVFQAGKNVLPPSAVSGTNRVPISYDELVGGIEAAMDKKLELLVNNPTGGALTLNWRMEQQQAWRS